LEQVVNKTRLRLIPFMLMLYILAFLDRANIGFAKASYQLDTGLGDGAFALGAGIFFVAYAFLGVPANLLMRKFGARAWIGGTTVVWGILSASMGYADSEWKFLLVRSLLGAAEAGFFPGMIYLTSQWFPQRSRAGIMGLFYMGAPLALTLGSPLSGALLEMHGFMGHPGWYWMFVIEGAIALIAGFATFLYLDNTPEEARFLAPGERELLACTLRAEESTKATSKIGDAVRRWPVWHLAIIYMIIQISVYGLVFYLPTQVAALMGATVGFKVSLVAAIPWVAALFGTYYIPRYSDRTGERRITAAMTLLVAGIGLGVSAFASPGIAIVALCFAAAGFIAVQPVFWTMPTGILSGAALAAGIGFTNMFGAFGGFLAPNIKAQADIFFGNHMAGLVILAIITVCGSAAILALRTKKAPRPVPSEG
jgi:MFS family permease